MKEIRPEVIDFNLLSTQDLLDLLKLYKSEIGGYVSEDDPDFDWKCNCYKNVLKIKAILRDREEVLSYND